MLLERRPARVDHVVEDPLAVRQLGESGAHPALAVGDDLVEGRVGERGQALDAHDVGADLRVEVALALLR